jgi:hypothetical protein
MASRSEDEGRSVPHPSPDADSVCRELCLLVTILVYRSFTGGEGWGESAGKPVRSCG